MARLRCVMVVAMLALAGAVSAQTSSAPAARPATPPETDAIAVLTREIRGLRTELAEAAKASLRLQLLTARMQAQEQRIIYLDRQRTEAISRRQTAELEISGLAQRAVEFDASKMPPEMRRQMEGMAAALKVETEAREQQLAEARAGESDAQNALAQEQSRWADLNQRLEDLERSLK